LEQVGELETAFGGSPDRRRPLKRKDPGGGESMNERQEALMIEAEGRLICALDMETEEEAWRLVDELEGLVSFFKVGIILNAAAGRQFMLKLRERGKQIFLDLKYFDIPQTVQRAVALAAGQGFSLLTVHGDRSIIEAAVAGRGESSLKILAVTVLTSMDTEDLRGMGISSTVEELVEARAKTALELGCDGVVCSAREIGLVRKVAGERLLIVTPGIRPAQEERQEQKRALTPAEALERGADYLVVGRPIYGAADPRAAAARILEEMRLALPGGKD